MAFNPHFEPAISPVRLGTYRAIATDDDHAWALYRWNIDLAAALTPLACDVEVVLRNTIHNQLTAHFEREDWWASTDLVLDDITSETLADVVRRHKKQLAKGTIGDLHVGRPSPAANARRRPPTSVEPPTPPQPFGPP